MNKSISQNITSFHKAAGLQILVSEENNLLFSFLIMQKRKNKIKILSKGSGINSFEEIKDKIPNKMPVCMAITGKGILMKEIIAGQAIISPNSSNTFIDQKNNPDLYSQYITGHGGKTYVAIIRKERLDELLGEATKVRLEVISYNLGPLSISNLEALFNTGDYEFSTKPYHLTVSNGLIAEIKKDSDQALPLKLFDSQIDSVDIIPFASAYTLISGFTTINSYDQIDQIEKIKTFKKFKRLVKFEKMLLVIFLGILLINSVFFLNLNHKSSELNFEANELNGMLKQISTLEKEINKEKLLIEKSGLSTSTITSYYADRIASTRPKGIIFTRMSFNPLIKEKNINEIIFNKDIIQISGTTENSLLFNEWTEAIKKYKWVDKIDLISYKNQVEYNGNDFEIKIHIIKDVF